MQGLHGLQECGGIHAPITKRSLCTLTLLFICHLSILLAIPSMASGTEIPAGDLAPLDNPDGELNVADFLILQKFVLGTLIPTPEQLLIADVAPLGNPDGELNAGDMVVLMRAIHGLVSLPPIQIGPNAPVLTVANGTTDQNPYFLTGESDPGQEIRIYLNGEPFATTGASVLDGTFGVQLILEDGANSIYAVVVDSGVEGPPSDMVALEYENNVPRDQDGLIDTNSVWTPGTSNEPYVIGAGVTVAPDTTLTLMPGTVLSFGAGASLVVEGTLEVKGTASNPVRFTSGSLWPARGDWEGINVTPDSGGAVIDGAIIEYARNGISVDTSQLVIKNCHISNFGANFTEHGVGFFNGAGGVVENCVIDNQASSGNNWSRGIYVANSSAPEIRENHIKNTGIGIVIWNSSPWVVGNLVERNVTGIYSYGDSSALINGQNVITENSQAGLEFGAVDGGVSPNCIVKNNNIFNNKWNVMTDDYDRAIELEVDVSGNWWGSASPSVVSSGIFDFKGIWEASPPVKIVPFLDAPGGNPVQGNFLNGRVDQDTTLLAGEAYTVVGSYVIIPNTKLTVQPGARLEFSSTALLYSMGDIDVAGLEGSEAAFITAGHAGDLPVGGGVIISGVAEAAIEWAHFENLNWGLYILASEVVVKNSKFSNNQRASISASNSNVSIIDNIFERSGGEFCDYGCIGVDLYGSGNVSIERNNFSGGNVGIFVSNGSPEIKENTITGNNYGISLDESGYASWTSPVITNGNVIANNDYGVYSNNITRGSVSVNGNNIHGNGFNYYKTRSSHVEDATNNWWGSAIESEVSGTIYTQYSGAVAYVPFLAGPAPIAPQLFSGAQYTAESAFPVTGSAQPGIQVRLYVNGVEHLVVVADPGGAFSGTVALDEGENHIHAEAFNQTTVSSASNSISVILDTIPPGISIARPFNGDRLNANPMFSGTVSEPVILTIAGEPVLVSEANEFTHGPVRLSEGLNSIPIIAEDIAGNVTLQTIDLIMDTTPPENPDMNLVVFGPLLGGVVNVTGSAGAVEAGVQVYVANSRTGVVSMVVSNGDGGFTAVIDAQPADALTLTVADDLGNQAVWNHEIVEGVPAVLSISNVSPINGSVINGDRVMIAGEFDGPEGVGIVVSGQPADLYGNRFVASDVQLSAGLNSIEITASSPNGQVYTHDLTLTSSGEIPFKVSVSPESGLLPYIGELIVINETGQPMQSVEIDIDNDGVFDGSFFNLNYSEASWDIWYGTPGLHIGRVRIVDYAGVSHELSYGLMVEELVGKQSRLQMIYRNMMSNLASGSIEGALARIAGTSRERYDEIFTMLGSDLGAIAQDFGEIRNIVLGDGWAELLLVRESGGVKTAYRINLFQGEDGVWRIESM